MRKTTILALAAALLSAGAASAYPRDGYRDDGYERGDPRAPGGYERGYRYEYGDPAGPVYGAGERYEFRSEYDSRHAHGDRYGWSRDPRGHGDRPRRPVGYSLPTYGDAAQFYGYPCASACRGYRAPCGCAGGAGELTLGSSFFYDSGGVGPIPDGGYYGGGYAIVGAGAGASAHASASAYASSRASIRIGGKGGHGGKPCCHGGKGK